MGDKADAEREFAICNRLNVQRQRTGSGIAGQQVFLVGVYKDMELPVENFRSS